MKNHLLLILVFLFLVSCEEEINGPGKNNGAALKNSSAQPNANNAKIGAHSYWYFFRGETTPNLRSAYSDDGVTWSGNVQFNNNAKSSTEPAAAYFNGKFVCVYKGNTTSSIYFSYSTDGLNWLGNILIPNIATAYTPSAVVYNNLLYVFYTTGSDHDVGYITSSDGINWSSETILDNGGYLVTSASTVSTVVDALSNKLYIFYWAHQAAAPGIPAGDYIKYRTFNSSGSLSGFSFLYGVNSNRIESTTGVGLAFVNGKMHVAYKSKDNDRLNIFIDHNGFYGDVYWTNAQTTNKPGLIYLNNKFTLVYKAQSTGTILYSNSTDGVSWTGNLPAIGQSNGGAYLIGG